MITVKIVVNNIDYDSIIKVVKREASPSFFQKIGLDIAGFFSKYFMSQKKKDKLIISYCQKNEIDIINKLQSLVEQQGIGLSIESIEVE